MLQNQDSFLFEVSKFFEIGRSQNKLVTISMKPYDGRTGRNPRKSNDKPNGNKPDKQRNSRKQQPSEQSQAAQPTESKCLLRARVGKKKVSFAIASKDINKFQQSYSNLIKGNIYGLKKKQLSGGS